MEELHLGSDHPEIKLDIPFPEMADIDLTYPLLGLDWVMYPWTYTKQLFAATEGLTMDMLTSLTESWNYIVSNAEDIGYALLSAVALAVGVVSAIMIVRWIKK